MSDLEQRYAIKFCGRLGYNASKVQDLLQLAYGEGAYKKTAVCKWHKRFLEGRETVEDDDRAGRPQTGTNDNVMRRVQEVLEEDRRLSVSDVAARVGISTGTAYTVITEQLSMSRVCARWVPHRLTDEQMQRRVATSRLMLNLRFQLGEAFLRSIVTGDETWIYFYDPETKQQSSIWKTSEEPTPTKVKTSRATKKVMFAIFFDAEGLLLVHEIPQGTTVNGQAYKDILQVLVAQVRRKRPQYQAGQWRLLHDNAPAHTSHLVIEYLASQKIEMLEHPPYSPDLAPCDFYLFPKTKKLLRGRRFQTLNEVRGALNEALRTVAKEGLYRAFLKWEERLNACIEAEGRYFEKE